MLHCFSPSIAISLCISNSIHPVWCIDIIFIFSPLSFSLLLHTSFFFFLMSLDVSILIDWQRRRRYLVRSWVGVDRRRRKKCKREREGERKERKETSTHPPFCLIGWQIFSLSILIGQQGIFFFSFFFVRFSTADDDLLFSTQFFFVYYIGIRFPLGFSLQHHPIFLVRLLRWRQRSRSNFKHTSQLAKEKEREREGEKRHLIQPVLRRWLV